MKNFLAVSLISTALLCFPACKEKMNDEDIRTSVEASLATNPDYAGLTVEVDKGVVTLTGQVSEDSSKKSLPDMINALEGVKSVRDSSTVIDIIPSTEAP